MPSIVYTLSNIEAQRRKLREYSKELPRICIHAQALLSTLCPQKGLRATFIVGLKWEGAFGKGSLGACSRAGELVSKACLLCL